MRVKYLLVYDLIIGEKGRSPGTGPLLVLKKYLDLEELRRDASKFMGLNKELEGIYTNPVFEWYKEFTDEWGNTIQDHWVFGRDSKGLVAHLNGELVNILPAAQWIAVIYWKYQGYLKNLVGVPIYYHENVYPYSRHVPPPQRRPLARVIPRYSLDLSF